MQKILIANLYIVISIFILFHKITGQCLKGYKGPLNNWAYKDVQVHKYLKGYNMSLAELYHFLFKIFSSICIRKAQDLKLYRNDGGLPIQKTINISFLHLEWNALESSNL